jgi:hypothetical protein
MKFFPSLLMAASLAKALPRAPHASRALYFLDSDPQGASVVSFKVAEDGSLGTPQKTSSGGKGLIGNNMNGQVAVDPLFSQDSIIVRGDRLFTVNAGSNTLASFHIPEHDPTHPVLLGEPVDTVGNVPNSVAYSEKHNLACVSNTGSKPGVQCFKVKPCGELEPQGKLLPLPIYNQTVPPVGPPNTTSDILFNPSESALFVVIKGDGTNDGWIYAYKVLDGKVNEQPVKSRLNGVPTPFGTTFVTDCSAVVTSPAFGAAFVDVAFNLTVTVDTIVEVPGQGATCWAAFSEARGSMYLLDGGVPAVTALNPSTKAIGRTIPGYEAGMGNFDGIVGGGKLYALQAEPAIAIFDLENPAGGPSTVDISDLGNRSAFIGMAYYSS